MHQLIAFDHQPFLNLLRGQNMLVAQFSFLVFLTWLSSLPELQHMMPELLNLYLTKSICPHLLPSHTISPGL